MKTGYQATIITNHNQLSEEEIQSLWDQDVNMDDWDCIIILPVGCLYREEDGDLTPHDYQIYRLLDHHGESTWYEVRFRGEKCTLGIRYH